MAYDIGFDFVPVFTHQEVKAYQRWLTRVSEKYKEDIPRALCVSTWGTLQSLKKCKEVIKRLLEKYDAKQSEAHALLREMQIDLHPFRTAEEIKQYEAFLGAVRAHYISDPLFHETKHRLIFDLGECPTLYTDSQFQRRFSSESCDNLRLYLDRVWDLAQKYVPDHVKWWSDFREEEEAFSSPAWEWTEVQTQDALVPKEN